MDTKQEADMGVTKESFGFLEDKREAFLYTIENQNGFAVKVTDFGVNIVSLLVKNEGTEKVDYTVYIWYNVSIKYRRCFYDRTTAEIDAKSIHGNI